MNDEKKEEYSYDQEGLGEQTDHVSEAAVAYAVNPSVIQSELDACLAGDKTMKDYLALPEGTRIEMINGVFYDMAAPNVIHQQISSAIMYAFLHHVKANRGTCVPFAAPTDVQLDCDDKTMVQPDVFVVCDRKKIIRERIVGAPELVVEIVSPGNHNMDEVIKLMKYRNAGVREYWLIQPEDKRVLVYFFEASIDPVEYSFEQKVPVGIWEGKCEVDFREVQEHIRFLYEDVGEN